MTDIETEIIEFTKTLDTVIPEIDDLLRKFIHTISEDKTGVVYGFDGTGKICVTFNTGGVESSSEFLEPEILFYCTGAILTTTTVEAFQENIVLLMKKGLDIGEVFIYYFNILLAQLRIEAIEWEILEKP